MIYADTSVLVAYYCPEPRSEKAEAFLMAHTQPVISTLTEVEFFSALSKKVREKGIGRKDGDRVIARFLAHVNNHYYTCLDVETQHFRLARDWIGMFKVGLRSLDAIHLAVASLNGLTLVTSDEQLFKSAKSMDHDAIFLK